jgi:hypothetical protein
MLGCMSPATHNNSSGRRAAWIAAGLVILAAVAGGMAFSVRDAWRNWRRVLLYSEAVGTVIKYQHSSVTLDARQRLVQVPGKIVVEYEALGETQVATFTVLDSAGRYEIGQNIKVHYDPQMPSRAAMSLSVHPRSLAAVLVLLPLAAGGLWLIWAGMRGVDRYGLLPPMLLSYFLFSCLAAGVLLSLMDHLTWQQSWILGAGLAVPVVPLTSILGGAVLSNIVRARRQIRPVKFDFSRMPRLSLSFIFAMVLLTVIVLGGVAMASWTFIEQARAYVHARDRYLQVDGTVLSAAVGQTAATATTQTVFYWPDIAYHYRVNGKDYWSRRYSDTGGYFDSRQHAYLTALRYTPPGLMVNVYYDPHDPSRSVLERNLPEANLMLLLALQPPALGALVLLGALVYIPIQRRAIRRFVLSEPKAPSYVPTWGKWQIEEEGLIAVDPMPRRLPAAMISYCFACLIMLLIGALAGGSEWFGVNVLIYSTVACICAGLLGWLLAGRCRPNRLEIDASHHTLRLMGKQQDAEVAFADLAAYVIEPEGIWARLRLVTTGGSEITLHEFRPAWPLTPSVHVARKIAEGLQQATGGVVLVKGMADETGATVGGESN